MISIIVPIYNMEKYLRRCLDSLVNQATRKKYEIILVNDGSKDKSKNICEEYEKKYFNIKLVNQSNQGVSQARNTGIFNSSGEYIIFCDGDDELDINTIDSIYKNIDLYNPDLIIFGREDIQGDTVIAKYNKHNEINMLNCNNVKYVEEYFANGTHTFVVCNKVYKREIILKNKILFNKSLKLSEDTLFNLEYIIVANSFCENFTISYKKNCLDGSTIYRNIDNFFEKNIQFIDCFAEKLTTVQQEEFKKSIYKLYYFYGKISIFRVNEGIDGKSLFDKLIKIRSVLNDTRFIEGCSQEEGNRRGFKDNILYSLYRIKSSVLIYALFGFGRGIWRKIKKVIRKK